MHHSRPSYVYNLYLFCYKLHLICYKMLGFCYKLSQQIFITSFASSPLLPCF